MPSVVARLDKLQTALAAQNDEFQEAARTRSAGSP